MTLNEIKSKKQEILKNIKNKRLSRVFFILDSMTKESAVLWPLRDEFEKIETGYKYMLEYFAKGVDDPMRNEIYNDIIEKLYLLTDKIAIGLWAESNYSIYYTIRASVKRANTPLRIYVDEYRKLIVDYDLLRTATSNADELPILEQLERKEKEIFNKVFVSYPLCSEDIDVLSSVFADDVLPEYFKEFLVSSLMMQSLEFYDENALLLLLKLYNSSLSNAIKIKALCSALLLMLLHNERTASSIRVRECITSLADDEQFSKDVKLIMLQYIRGRSTDKITQKVEKDLIPNLMKMSPDLLKKFKSGDTPMDISDLEGNPEWKDMMDKSGFSKRIEELNEIQLDGGDVFASTFSHLKSFPFFNEICNWFMPFHTSSPSLKRILGENRIKVLDIIKQAKYLCDSDKYSMCLSLNSIPTSQLDMMMSQFDTQVAELKELKNSELNPTATEREDYIKQYMQDIYRFFKIFQRRSDFTDPFVCSSCWNEVSIINAVVDNTDTFALIGELYLKYEYYNDAIKYLSFIVENNKSFEPTLLQKIGYCYQSLNENSKALEYYKRYELFATDDLWNIRHIASCYRANGDFSKALEYFKKADAIKENNPTICLNIGHCLLELNNYEEALKYYFKVDYLEPNKQRAWRPIAWCSLLSSNFEQSYKYYNKILNTKPNAVDYLNYGHLCLVQKNISKAIEAYENSVKLDSDNFETFAKSFMADKDCLIKLGVSESDIPVLLDKIAFDVQK